MRHRDATARAARPPRSAGAMRAIAIGASVLGGVGVAAQNSINGHVSVITGTPILATAVNHTAALVLSIIVGIAMGAFPRAWRRLRERRATLSRWWFFGGILGFIAMVSIITIVPVVGLVTLTVALTLGQLSGSLIADLAGLGPGGRKPPTAWRIAGLGVAVVAVFAGSWGRLEGAQPLLLAIIVGAGILVAIQQAANGQLTVATGEFAVMSTINFIVGGAFVLTALLIVNAANPIDFSTLPPWAPLGGAVGAVVGVIVALSLQHVPLLSVMLSIVAGQAVAAIVFDLVLPVGDSALSIGSIVGAVLAIIAVGLAGFTRRSAIHNSTTPALEKEHA